MDEQRSSKPRIRSVNAGTGALCDRAQADGVPCFEAGRDCEECEKAFLNADPPPGESKGS